MDVSTAGNRYEIQLRAFANPAVTPEHPFLSGFPVSYVDSISGEIAP